MLPKNTTTQPKKSTYRPPKDEAEAERRRAYSRAYRAAHRDKVQMWNRTFYLRRAAKALGIKAYTFLDATRDGDAE